MIMENRLEKILRQQLSAESSEIPEPDDNFIKLAHQKIISRKRNTSFKSSFGFMNILFPRMNYYSSCFAALLLFLLMLFLPRNNQNPGFTEQLINQSRSASSCTVLAGLNQEQENNESVKSATVLTSIVTFAAKN